MTFRHDDGSAGDANYGAIGVDYSRYRQPDKRIGEFIRNALADAQSVLNVGAGAGSYEPTDRIVTAVEPSASMRAQRPTHLPTAIDATSERLPFKDKSFDASMATFTVHQWRDLQMGLKEMRRVTRDMVLILTGDPDELNRFWLYDYCPEVIAVEARRYPRIESITQMLGGKSDVISVPIPVDCTDGFGEAYYGRPEQLLDRGARLSCSAWSFVTPAIVACFETHLRADLEGGVWDLKYGHLRTQPFFDGSLKLIVARTST